MPAPPKNRLTDDELIEALRRERAASREGGAPYTPLRVALMVGVWVVVMFLPLIALLFR